VEGLGRGVDGMNVNWKVYLKLILLLLILFALGLMVWPTISYRTDRGYYGFARTKMEISSIAGALEQYEATYGSYPTGNPASVLKKLLGDNPQKHSFLDLNPRSISEHGEFLDVWGTPFKISISSTKFMIRSAGKNTEFGDGDDYVFDGTKRDFIQEPKR
jgi:Type II secretion system (T2SS), protein G